MWTPAGGDKHRPYKKSFSACSFPAGAKRVLKSRLHESGSSGVARSDRVCRSKDPLPPPTAHRPPLTAHRSLFLRPQKIIPRRNPAHFRFFPVKKKFSALPACLDSGVFRGKRSSTAPAFSSRGPKVCASGSVHKKIDRNFACRGVFIFDGA